MKNDATKVVPVPPDTGAGTASLPLGLCPWFSVTGRLLTAPGPSQSSEPWLAGLHTAPTAPRGLGPLRDLSLS